MAPETVSWQREPFPDRPSPARFLFHCLHWVSLLLDAQSGRPDDQCRQTAVLVVRRWIAECLLAERFEMVWDLHVTALRALVLSRVWAACRSAEPSGSPFMRSLAAALVRHADRLSTETCYQPTHNHGVTQAYALLAVGLALRGHPDADGWVRLGRDRLQAQMAANVSEEGVHREHSPHYHFYVFKQFRDAIQLGEAAGVAFSAGFRHRLRAMLAAGAHMLKPNGALPALGDTPRTSRIAVNEDELRRWGVDFTAEYLYSRTGGASGIPPSDIAVLYLGGGCAFLRSGWGAHGPVRDERYAAIRTATFPTTHLHRDLLSFELYAYGRDLVVDSGGPFGYGSPLREQYFVASSAHNVVLIDGGELPCGAARIVRWTPHPGGEILVAEHEPAPGVTHRRYLLFVRHRYWVLVDRLRSRNKHVYEQIFHLDPGLEPTVAGLAITTASAADGATVRIVPVLEAGLGLILRRGQDRPPQGWVCVGANQRVPGSVAIYRATATDTVLAVVIIPEPAGRPSAPVVRGRGDLLRGALHLDVEHDGTRDGISIDETGGASITSGRAGA
jgi:hypothetical protein